MSSTKGVLNTDQQLIYLTQWFTEMSEMQTQDFMKCLVLKYSHCNGQQTDNCLINGFNGFGVSDRPASIFQCRLKLLNEWFAQWSDEEKAELLVRLRNIDSRFMDEFQANLDDYHPSANGATDDDMNHMNGNVDDDSKSSASEQLVNGSAATTDHSSSSPSDESPTADDDKQMLADNGVDDDLPSSDAQQVIVINGDNNDKDMEVVDDCVKPLVDELSATVVVVDVNETPSAAVAAAPEVCG